MDAVILLLFIAAVALSNPGRREQARDSVAAFATSATLATVAVDLPWPWLHYAVMWCVCVVWLLALAQRGAGGPATAVGGVMILMAVMAVDRLLFPSQMTAIYAIYEVVAALLYGLAIIATIYHGRGGHAYARVPRRRRTDYIHNQASKVATR